MAKFKHVKGLPEVVWNALPQDIAADFRSGHFETQDPKLAERLRGEGYEEEVVTSARKPRKAK